GADVTALCGPAGMESARQLGAHHVIDRTTDELAHTDQRFDLVMQLSGDAGVGALRRIVSPGGTILLLSGDSSGHRLGPVGRIVRARLASPFVRERLVSFTVRPNGDDLDTLLGLVAAGTVRPVIDRVCPLAEVASAVHHVETRRARGKVIITP